MTIDEADPNPTSDHILDWIDNDSIPFPPSMIGLDDVSEINEYPWWDQGHEHHQDQDLIRPCNIINTTTTAILDPSPSSDSEPCSKKRKSPDSDSPPHIEYLSLQQHERGRQDRISESEDGDAVVVLKRTVSAKKSAAKSTGNNGNNKEGRWAEQLLNPCALAINTGNLTRVQHLLYVLHELASPSGDANHRLAAYGLRSLTHYLSSTSASDPPPPTTFTSTEPRLFQRSLLKFYEVSPWFTFTNTVANSSILQILAKEPDCRRPLHILDIGVSHGLQWPTLLEALSRRSGGPPPLLRLTIMQNNAAAAAAPFSMGPPGDDFPSRLLRFAKSINLNLQINLLNNQPLQTLNPQIINTSPDEALIVCAQFRTHHLNHTNPDDRTKFLTVLKIFEPKAVILCENDMECSCNHCRDFSSGFSKRVEYLWRFLDSTSSAFKGRECEERRVVEGEAATALMNRAEMNEGKEGWCEKMKAIGFESEAFGEDAIDGGRALLRRYDSNWEMRVDEKDGCVCLGWKGQPVSFCSLWTLGTSVNDS